ncbi:MAG TPA: Ig-like domain-containing protein, partial [Vicinamibacterales bacterium]|nr:Ig-like domain-containing protein [Vicinamibacterales bacterium]
MVRSSRLLAAIAVAALGAFGCAYHLPTEPGSSSPPPTPNLTPSTIRITASSRTDQTVGITATVLSSDGHFVPNVALTLSVDAGTVSPTTATTDANGGVQASASTPSVTTLHVSGGGVSAQATLPASVAAPVADAVLLNVPGTGTAGVPVTMFVSSAASATWSWNFGDGATSQTTSLSTTHTYGQAGRYTVSVSGASGTASAPITINNAPTP